MPRENFLGVFNLSWTFLRNIKAFLSPVGLGDLWDKITEKHFRGNWSPKGFFPFRVFGVPQGQILVCGGNPGFYHFLGGGPHINGGGGEKNVGVGALLGVREREILGKKAWWLGGEK